MATTYIQRVDSTDGNRKVWTWSAWVKRDVLGSVDQNMFSMGEAASEEAQFKFSSDQLSFFNDYASSGRVSATSPSRKFRDTNGWYHFVWRHKSDESTASDRWKIYINGERLDPSDYGNPSIPNEDGCYNKFSNRDMWFGARAKAQNDNSYQYFSGLMSHIHFCDGYAYDASDFGSTDATTGEWKINTNPNVQYGSKGFFILKDGNSVTDQSGNGNNCTVGGGTLTKSEDCPSNVFCTYNPLQQTNGSAGFENGNNYFTNGTQWLGVNGTLAATSGKYYAEFKVTGSTGWGVGVADVDSDANRTDLLSSANNGYQSKYTGGKQIFLNGSTIIAQENNSTVINNAGMGNTSFANNDIIMVALDLDNNNLFFGKNGTWLRGATESEIEAGTSTNATFSGTSFNDKFWTWSVTTELENMRMNAGNGYFSTTAVSSAGTNASGNGIFEYDVPTGFTALSTKGLNL